MAEFYDPFFSSVATTSLKEHKAYKKGTEAMEKLKGKLGITSEELAVVLGLSFFGLNLLINAYDGVSGYSKLQKETLETDEVKKASKIRLVVLLLISAALLAGGMKLSKGGSMNKLIPLSLQCSGVFGLVYALTFQMRGSKPHIKSLVSLIGFGMFVFYALVKKPGEESKDAIERFKREGKELLGKTGKTADKLVEMGSQVATELKNKPLPPTPKTLW